MCLRAGPIPALPELCVTSDTPGRLCGGAILVCWTFKVYLYVLVIL